MSFYKSNSEEICFYIKELLKDGKEHSRKEIEKYILEHSPNANNFTVGMFTAALKNLVNNTECYVKVAHGYYQKLSRSEMLKNNQKQMIDILNKTCDDLKMASVFNIIGMTSEELRDAQEFSDKLKELIEFVETERDELKEMMHV